MGEEGECGCGGNEVRCGGCVGLESVNLFRYTGGGKLICCLGVWRVFLGLEGVRFYGCMRLCGYRGFV